MPVMEAKGEPINLLKWRMVVAMIATLLLCLPWYWAQTDHPGKRNVYGKVTRVIDGDTLDVSGVGRVRLVGVNTPEEHQEGYLEATDFLRSACLGKTVSIDIDDENSRDHFGRILAVVYQDGRNINAEILKSGHGEILYLPPSEFDPSEWI